MKKYHNQVQKICHRYIQVIVEELGEGETLSFQTEPDKEYYLKVTNKISIYDYKIEDILFSFNGTIEEEEPAQSALPYSVNLVGKVIPS